VDTHAGGCEFESRWDLHGIMMKSVLTGEAVVDCEVFACKWPNKACLPAVTQHATNNLRSSVDLKYTLKQLFKYTS
jgi:hypothetical protein